MSYGSKKTLDLASCGCRNKPETAAKQIANAIKCFENGKTPPNIIERKLGY